MINAFIPTSSHICPECGCDGGCRKREVIQCEPVWIHTPTLTTDSSIPVEFEFNYEGDASERDK